MKWLGLALFLVGVLGTIVVLQTPGTQSALAMLSGVVFAYGAVILYLELRG